MFGNQPFMTSPRVRSSTELKVKQEKEVMDGLVSFNDKLKMHTVGKGSGFPRTPSKCKNSFASWDLFKFLFVPSRMTDSLIKDTVRLIHLEAFVIQFN